MSRCKSCSALYSKCRYALNKEHFKQRWREYYLENREYLITKSKKWRCDNPEKAKEALRKWRTENKPRTRVHVKTWQAKNQEAVRLIKRGWEQRNPDAYAASLKKYRENNKEKVASFMRANRANRRNAFVERVDDAVVYERDMGLCQICGLPVEDGDFHLEHRTPLSRGGEHSYANCQTAHGLCNIRKSNKYPNECDHLWMRS